MPFTNPQIRSLATAAVSGLLLLAPSGASAEGALNFIVIGDSASDEYAEEIPFSLPENPAGHTAMSWVEWLSAMRPDQVSFGNYLEPFREVPRLDLRLWGYEGNFSFPGHHADDAADLVKGATVFDQAGRMDLDALLNGWADVAVIFVGANDLGDEYDGLYDGEAGAADAFVDSVSRDINTIAKYLAEADRNLDIIIANVPDVSVAPKEQIDHPDPKKRARVAAATARLNEELKTVAARWGAAIADTFTPSQEIIRDGGYTFDGTFLIGEGHPDNDTNYLFTRDNFHPNSGAQLIYAREIVNTANRAFNTGIPAIGDREILDVLGLTGRPSPIPTASWLGNEWQRLSGFGNFFSGSFPWIYHDDLRWLWVATTDPGSLWLWTEALGFIWTSADLYPNIYSHDRETWLWFDTGGDSLYDYSDGTWSPAPF